MSEKNTSLKRIMDEREVSLYKIMKELGHNPKNSHGHFASKVNGQQKVTREQLEEICAAIEKLSDEPLKINSLDFTIETVTII